MNNDTNTESKDPTFTELRHEAQATMRKLIKANNGLIEPEAILHTGIFFGMLDKQLSGNHRVSDTQHDYYVRAHDILNKVEQQSIEVDDVRTVQITGYELGTLRNALEVLHDKGK